jgi:hypothetical protein
LLDRIVDLAMQLGGNSSDAAWKNFSGFGRELGEKLWIGCYDLVGRNVMPTTGHFTVRLTEIDTALDCFWLGHKKLAEFAVKGAAFEEVIEFHFLQTTWCAETLFVTRGDVARSRLALSFRFGAF